MFLEMPVFPTEHERLLCPVSIFDEMHPLHVFMIGRQEDHHIGIIFQRISKITQLGTNHLSSGGFQR
jgi:hypothetical protein